VTFHVPVWLLLALAIPAIVVLAFAGLGVALWADFRGWRWWLWVKDRWL
jgi:hypothetical protein